MTPEEQAQFDAIVAGEQARDPFFRAGRAVGLVIVPIIGLGAVTLIVLAAFAAILACSGVFTWRG